MSLYGPFTPLVDYVGAIVATGFMLLLMWSGRMKKWLPPDEDLPGTAKKIVLLLCSVGVVFLWRFAAPSTIDYFLAIVLFLTLGCLLCFLRYTGLLGTYVFHKRVASGTNSTRDERILGGRELLPEAEKKRQEHGIDIQSLLEGAAYNPDLLWSREARQSVKQTVLFFFILTLFLGTSALTGAGLAVQVLLTKQEAQSVTNPNDAVGLK